MNDVFPYPLSYDEVLEETHQRTANAYRSEANEFRDFFRRVFVEGYRIGLVELYAEPPRFARSPGPRAAPQRPGSGPVGRRAGHRHEPAAVSGAVGQSDHAAR